MKLSQSVIRIIPTSFRRIYRLSASMMIMLGAVSHVSCSKEHKAAAGLPKPLETKQSPTALHGQPANLVAKPDAEQQGTTVAMETRMLIDDPIASLRGLPGRLVAVGEIHSEEDDAVKAAFERFLVNGPKGDFSDLEGLLKQFPAGSRSHAIRQNLAELYYSRGNYSKAYAMWAEAWEKSKDLTSVEGKLIAGDAAAGYIKLSILFGRKEELEPLLLSLKNRENTGPVVEAIVKGWAAYDSMQNWQEQSYKCGPFALFRVRTALGMENPYHPEIAAQTSDLRGTSIAQLLELGKRMDMPLKAVRDVKAEDIPIPSVVHWKMGHYSAVVGKDENGAFIVEDTNFAAPMHISPEVMDEESSGRYLALENESSRKLELVSNVQAASLWGRMTPPSTDANDLGPEATDGCKGMAGWSMGEMNVNLRITDTPVSYSAPVGPQVGFMLTYNARDSSQPSIPTYSNLGNKWSHNWMEFIQDNPSSPLGDVKRQRASGGLESYSNFNSTTGNYLLQPRSATQLVKTGPSSYELRLPGGAKSIFAASDGTVSGSRRIFISKEVDASGNELTYQYDTAKRLVKLIDAAGKETTIAYGITSQPYLITAVTDPYGRSANMAYDAMNRLISITDTVGIISRFAYSSTGEITTLTTPYGKTTFETIIAGFKRQVTITNPIGQRDRYELLSANTAQGIPELPAILPASETVSPEIAVPTNYYNSRATVYWDKKGMKNGEGDYTKATLNHWLSTATSSYTLSGVKAAVKRPGEQTVFFKYPNQPAPSMAGTLDKPIKIVRRLPDGQLQITSLEYNTWGLPTKVIDPLGRETLTEYAADGYSVARVKQKVGSGYETLMEVPSRNGAGLPLQIKDAAGRITSMTYNARGQIETITDPELKVTSFTYQENAALLGYKRPQTAQSVVAANSSSVTYDAFDRIATSTGADGYSTAYQYDAFDRPTRTTYPDATFETYEYSNLELVRTKDREGRVSERGYDAARRLRWDRDPLGGVTQYVWCSCGSLSELIDPKGQSTKWTYSLTGRNLTKVYPDGRTYQMNYDTVGRLTSAVDPKGQSTVITYALDGSPLTKTYQGAVIPTSGVSYTYDPAYPRLASWTDNLGTTSTTYGPNDGTSPGAGGIASVDGPWANDTFTYSYDNLGRSSGYTLPNGGESVTFDTLGRAQTTTSVLGTSTMAYDGVTSRPLSIAHTSGLGLTMAYENAAKDFRLKQLSYTHGTTGLISQNDYLYSTAGRITSWERSFGDGTPAVANAYQYDLTDQLTQATTKDKLTQAVLSDSTYRYDAAGNRVSEKTGTTVRSGTHNSVNQLGTLSPGGPVVVSGSLSKEAQALTISGAAVPLSGGRGFRKEVSVTPGLNRIPIVVTEANGTVTSKFIEMQVESGVATVHTYDLNGNLESVAPQATPTQPLRSYKWDAADRLIEINRYLPDGVFEKTAYTYNGMGERVGKSEFINSVKQSSVAYLYDATGVLQERSADGSTVRKTYTGEGEMDYTTTPPTPRYYTRDHLGSVREVLDSNGILLARYDYTPYGVRSRTAGTYEAEKGYTGHDYHAASGTVLTRYRAYDPQTARWLSVDPRGENGGMNLYGYVGNNPVNATDPLGLEGDDAALGAALFAQAQAAARVAAVGAAAGAVSTTPAGERALEIVEEAGEPLVEQAVHMCGKTSVYSSIVDGVTNYVGITNNIIARASDHVRDKGIIINKIAGLTNLSRSDARSVEQVLIEIHGIGTKGGTLINLINSIATSNPKYVESIERGKELLTQAGLSHLF